MVSFLRRGFQILSALLAHEWLILDASRNTPPSAPAGSNGRALVFAMPNDCGECCCPVVVQGEEAQTGFKVEFGELLGDLLVHETDAGFEVGLAGEDDGWYFAKNAGALLDGDGSEHCHSFSTGGLDLVERCDGGLGYRC